MTRQVQRINIHECGARTGVTAFFQADGKTLVAISHKARARVYASSVEEANDAANLFREMIAPAMDAYLKACAARGYGIRGAYLTAESPHLVSGSYEGEWSAMDEAFPEKVIVVEVEKS